MQEIWKEVKDYPNYEISNFGRVKALKFYSNVHKKYYDRELILKEKTNRFGYKFVSLGCGKRGNRKNVMIHRLVAQAFIHNSNNYKEINHIDGNKANNNVNNLEWCTRSENMKHAYKIGLRRGIPTKEVIQLADGKIIKRWASISEIKNTLNLDYSSIYQCCNNKRNKCGGFQWRYLKEDD